MQKKTVSNKSALFAVSESKLHYIRVAPDSEEYLKIWIKEPTFLQLEKAQAKLININTTTNDVALEMDALFRYQKPGNIPDEKRLTAPHKVAEEPVVAKFWKDFNKLSDTC